MHLKRSSMSNSRKARGIEVEDPLNSSYLISEASNSTLP